MNTETSDLEPIEHVLQIFASAPGPAIDPNALAALMIDNKFGIEYRKRLDLLARQGWIRRESEADHEIIGRHPRFNRGRPSLD